MVLFVMHTASHATFITKGASSEVWSNPHYFKVDSIQKVSAHSGEHIAALGRLLT